MISPDPVPAEVPPFALIVTTEGRTFCATGATSHDDWVWPLVLAGMPDVTDEPDEDEEGELIAFAITPPTTPPATAQPAQAISSQLPGPRLLSRACVVICSPTPH
jgi:hypothetical protein